MYTLHWDDKQNILLQVCQIGSVDDIQWGVAGGSDENQETVNQNIILINRQRQVICQGKP